MPGAFLPQKFPTVQSVTLPAPVGGLNALAAGGGAPPRFCLLAENLVVGEYGVRVRTGWKEWCTGLTGNTDDDKTVRSVLVFSGAAANGAGDKLWATTSTGIWDVSESSVSPTRVLAFTTTTGRAGYGVARTVVTAAGHYCLYCDEVNGLHSYSEGGGTWAAVAEGGGAGQISGVNPANLVHVAVHKGRVWLTQRDTAKVWYLAPGAVSGAATGLDMGVHFRAGGALRGVWTWTADGGAGLDDLLVAVSGAGDVAVWEGYDPSGATTWQLRGTWYVGALPQGRNVCSVLGGDLLLVTRLGVLPLSRLLAGGESERTQYSTAAIAPLFSSLMATRADLDGWALRMSPSDNALIVLMPKPTSDIDRQLVMSLGAKSWTRFRSVPMHSADTWGGKLYFGTQDGRVCVQEGHLDDVKLADSNDYDAIPFWALTCFTNLGTCRHKQVQSLLPTFLCESGAPSWAIEARYKYDFAEVASSQAEDGSVEGWDEVLWDEAVWGGDLEASQRLSGAAGMGRDIAVALYGTATIRCIWVQTDVLYTVGGYL